MTPSPMTQALLDAGVDLSPAAQAAFGQVEAAFREGVALDPESIRVAYEPLFALPKDDVVRMGRSLIAASATTKMPAELGALLSHLLDTKEANIPLLPSAKKVLEARTIDLLTEAPGFVVVNRPRDPDSDAAG